jgi:glycine cleavage system H lipoate-binding protein
MYRIVFLSAFYSVVATIAATVLCALLRARQSLGRHETEAIRWHTDFGDLPVADRACRHALTGEMAGRLCPNAFDCRVCIPHARFIAHAPANPAQDSEEDIFGMPFPRDRFYHRGHTWVKREPDGTVRIGLDELGRRLMAHPEAVELPSPGTQLKTNGAAFHLRQRGADVRILSPVDGEVVEAGGPQAGWYLRVRPANSNFTHLLRGTELRPWVMRELERLQLALTAEGAAPTLADGGVPVDDIAANFPAADWDAVSGEMFLAP